MYSRGSLIMMLLGVKLLGRSLTQVSSWGEATDPTPGPQGPAPHRALRGSRAGSTRPEITLSEAGSVV